MARSDDVLTRLRKTKYLGSHDRIAGQVEGVDVEFTAEGIRLRAKKSVIEIPWSNIEELAADDRESVESRVTGPRLLAMGAFALMAKKERVLSYLVIIDDRGEWLFEVPGLSAIELSSGLRPIRKYVPEPVALSPVREPSMNESGTSVAARLSKLEELRALGAITDAEHASQRQAIISSL